LLLCEEGALSEPILYLSLYLKTHRDRYYALLQEVREDGAWEEWLRFFLQGVQETSNQAFDAARSILELFKTDRSTIRDNLGQAADSALRVHEYLQENPIVTTARVNDAMAISRPTITSALDNLQELGIVREMTGKDRYRVYAYDDYLNILDEGTEPLSR
jgi:Fic family protein